MTPDSQSAIRDPQSAIRVGLLHGAGYVGGELIRLLLSHPMVALTAVTSRSMAGRPVWEAHPPLRGATELTFTDPDELDASSLGALLVAAEHGQSVRVIGELLERGYEGALVDLSTDFRFRNPALYSEYFGYTHPLPDLLGRFVYGIPELFAPYPEDTRWVANPGCFATGLTLALAPLARYLDHVEATVTALTGASGSGTRPKATTHFPTRDGNVRAYKVFRHQHLPEVVQSLGDHVDIAFVPVSGPWTRGIWGTAHVRLPDGVGAPEVEQMFEQIYGDAALVRVWPGELPELRASVGGPFADVGFVVDGARCVVGFGLDNLLKGAASQAIQNLNLLLGLPHTLGLLPSAHPQPAVEVATYDPAAL